MTSDRPFNLWTFSCAHVGTDLRRSGRESLADAIRQSEQGGSAGEPPFDWDIAINIGDISGSMGVPDDEEGAEVVRQFGALTRHRREAIYSIQGNHDRNATWEPEAEWFQKWVDPMGVNTEFSGVDPARRPYSVYGTWERYEFHVGNVVFLLMSDRNEPSQMVGRGVLGGNPGGVATGETWRWWQRRVEQHRSDQIIVSAHHYMLRDTTVASGPWEGVRVDDVLTDCEHDNRAAAIAHPNRYHGALKLGTPRGANYLYWVDSVPDAGLFERYLEQHPGATDLWLGGHTHTHPDDTYGGKSHIEQKWGVHFLNVCAVSKYHGRTNVPMSRVLTFTPGSDQLRVRCYLHMDDYAAPGWYPPAERTLTLSRPFAW
jgi:hypothetical protein